MVGNDRGLIQVLFLELTGGTEEKQEEPIRIARNPVETQTQFSQIQT
jgi:hypothetical protein